MKIDTRLLVLVSALIILFTFIQFRPLSLVPGPEGVRVITYGVQFNGGEVLKASERPPLPSGFQVKADGYSGGSGYSGGGSGSGGENLLQFYWGSTQASVLSIGHVKDPGEPPGGWFVNGPGWWYDHDQGEVRTEVQRPMVIEPVFPMATQTIEYYKKTKVNDNQIQINKMVLRIIPVDFILQISAVEGKGVYTWDTDADLRLWYALDTVTWMNAYISQPPPDPNPLTNETTQLLSSSYRGAFPIFAWADEYRPWGSKDPPDENAKLFTVLEPDLRGRTFDLYTAPTAKYSLLFSTDVVSNPDLLTRAFNPDALPDPRFSQTVYFNIRLVNFGAYVKPTGIGGSYSSVEVWYPAVFYKIRVVYAFWGEYVYLWTAKAGEQVGYTPGEWVPREPVVETSPVDFLTAFLRWLTSPLTALGLSLFTLLVIGVVAVVVLWWFFPRRGKR